MYKMILILIIILLFLYLFSYNKKYYGDNYFKIHTYISSTDKDNDGIDDQSDILGNAIKYVNKKPKYKSKYYKGGYSDDEYGVCTDVVVTSLLNSGYDLRELVNKDIINNKDRYNIEVIDKDIDFRRVRNLNVYFKYNHIVKTININKIEDWHGGDIVVFNNHIGIISNRRNKRGIPLVIHHYSRFQINYIEDILEIRKRDIIGHYRVS